MMSSIELPINDLPEDMPLEKCITEATDAIHLYLNNKFTEAKDKLRPWIKTSMYHALIYSVFNVIEAGYSFEPKQLQDAAKQMDVTLVVVEGFRKRSNFGTMISNMFSKKFASHTEEECHAHLLHAETLLLRAILTFVEQESLSNFIKAGIKMRKSYLEYKECEEILKLTGWEHWPSKSHFESGVKLGIGGFNLIVSLLPSKVIKLLEFFGMSGNRKLGLEYLEKGVEFEGARQFPCIIIILTYHLIMTFMLTFYHGDYVKCDAIVKDKLETKCPNGVFCLMLRARLEFVKGNLDQAIEWYIKMHMCQTEILGVNSFCFWELIWVYAAKSDWEKALPYAINMTELCKWSTCISQYQKASILLMMDKSDEEHEKLIQDTMAAIPTQLQKIAGKHIPEEKFVAKKAQRFLEDKNAIVVPMYELMFYWNIFKSYEKNKTDGKKTLEKVEEHLKKLTESTEKTKYDNDTKAMLLMLKGSCMRQMGSKEEAASTLTEAIAMEKLVKFDTQIMPYCKAELGITKRSMGDRKGAMKCLEDARKHSGYLLENRLEFRIGSALDELKREK